MLSCYLFLAYDFEDLIACFGRLLDLQAYALAGCGYLHGFVLDLHACDSLLKAPASALDAYSVTNSELTCQVNHSNAYLAKPMANLANKLLFRHSLTLTSFGIWNLKAYRSFLTARSILSIA
jgi:hypothetical protein